MQHDGNRNRSCNLFNDVVVDLNFTFIYAVCGTNSNRQSVNLGFFVETQGFFRLGQLSAGFVMADVVFSTADGAQLAFNGNAHCVSNLDDFLGQTDVLFERIVGAVEHNGAEAGADTLHGNFEAAAVVKMKGDGQTGLLGGSFRKSNSVLNTHVLQCAFADTEDNRGFQFCSSFSDGLSKLKVVHVELTYRVFACFGLRKELIHRN
ncbi:hypothetical protein D3C75_766410 [compost metagenome]